MTNVNTYEGSSRTMSPVGSGMLRVRFHDGWSVGDRGRARRDIRGLGSPRHKAAMTSFCLAAHAKIPTHLVREEEGAFVVKELKVPTHESLSGMTHGEVLNGEWIWRTHLEGSLWNRVQVQEVDPFDLGFDRGYMPKKGEKLPRTKLECTTKFEPIDRKVSDEEACELMQLTETDWTTAWELITQVVEVTTEVAACAGFYQPDGKLELGRLNDGRLIIADTFGTQDENRIIHRQTGDLYSKDLIRHYLTEQGYTEALREAQARWPADKDRWPEYPTLPQTFQDMVVRRYSTFAGAYARAAQAVL